jgi:hypothetical protein
MKFLLAFCIFSYHFSLFASDWKTKIIQDAITLYAPVSLSTFGKPLILEMRDDSTQAAAAHHNFTTLDLIVYRGLLDSPRLTPDGLRMIVCHELGHLFGGAPRKNVPLDWDGPIADDGLSYLSTEGQADYYAGMICFRKLVEYASVNEPQPDMKRVGPTLRNKCTVGALYTGKEVETCLRSGLAGEDFLKLTYEFPISCEKEDTSKTLNLIRDSYPGRQCRLDTIVSGGLCHNSNKLVLDFMSIDKSGCQESLAIRPQCWMPRN